MNTIQSDQRYELGNLPPDAVNPRDMSLLLQGLSQYGIIFRYRPDITAPHARWVLGGSDLFGYENGDSKSSSTAFYSIIHPRDALLVVQSRDEQALGETAPRPITCEYRVRVKSGDYIRVRSILTILQPPTTGGRRASIEMIRIIDERISYDQAATKLSEDALSTVLNEIGYPVVLMDRAGFILQANEAAEQLCGSLDAVERFCPFLHNPDGTLIFSGFLDHVIAHGQRATKELYRFDRWWHVHLVPIRDNTHAVARILLLAQDITSIKIAQENTLRQERALTRTFIREIHHRIKNHLQGLVGLIRLNEDAPRPTASLVTSMVTQIQSIAAMHGLLAKSGKPSVELLSLIAEIVAAHRRAAAIQVRFDSTLSSTLSVELTENEAIPIAVAISELITNATKHTEQTQSATVAVTLSEHCPGYALRITNTPARLPENFQLPDWLSRQSGLTLVLTLLSGSRFTLTFEQHEHSVTACLAFKA